MIQKSLSLALISLLLQVICVTPVLSQQTSSEMQRIAKLKERLNTIGIVEKKQVVVTQRDGTKLTGRISEMKEDSFVITDNKTGSNMTVPYSNVVQVKSKGSGLSTGTKIAIGVGIAAAVFLTWGLIYSRSCPTSLSCR